MKKFGYVVLGVILAVLFLRSCTFVDLPADNSTSTSQIASLEPVDYPMPENITVDGVDLRMSQAPVGKFGGTLVASTIGEGPKTFNPFNSKDNISSAMSEVEKPHIL